DRRVLQRAIAVAFGLAPDLHPLGRDDDGLRDLGRHDHAQLGARPLALARASARWRRRRLLAEIIGCHRRRPYRVRAHRKSKPGPAPSGRTQVDTPVLRVTAQNRSFLASAETCALKWN